MKQNKIIIAYCLLSFLLTACGNSSSSDNPKTRFSRKKLSLEDSKIFITSTIYYIPDYSDIQNDQCSDAVQIRIKKSKNKFIDSKLCRPVFRDCLMQGSCFVKLDHQKQMINYHKKVGSVVQFQIVDLSVCPNGQGDSSDSKARYSVMCLDPYRSVAADLSLYPLGTVIFIQDIVGTVLPNGKIHDGYFIVRDSGGNIDGYGRFDFYTGFHGVGRQNVFSQIGLGGEANYPYQIVTGPEAERVLQQSGFPRLN